MFQLKYDKLVKLIQKHCPTEFLLEVCDLNYDTSQALSEKEEFNIIKNELKTNNWTKNSIVSFIELHGTALYKQYRNEIINK